MPRATAGRSTSTVRAVKRKSTAPGAEAAPQAKRKAKSSAQSKDDDAGLGDRKLSRAESGKAAAASASGGSSNGQCWLFKSEPETRIENGVDVKFGINDLAKEPNQTAHWDGVRNYQARNFMRDQMKVGDMGFFYHSNCKPPGVAGIVRVVKEGYVDHTQFDHADAHFDPKSKKDEPRWYMVDVQLVRKLKRFVPLNELKSIYQEHAGSGGPLAKLALFTSARLSVQPVKKEEFDFIVQLSE